MYNIDSSNNSTQSELPSQELLNMHFEQLEVRYDRVYKALWCTLKSKPLPVFTPTLLQNIRHLQDSIAKFSFEHPNHKPKYIIWESDNPEVFSLGLDLGHIQQLIISQDKRGLNSYIQSCMDVFYINLLKLDISPMITISLIRGKAFGGGFEAALSSDLIVAEENARCCFPEIRHHLLPSLGTLKMLLRRYPPCAMQSLLFEGKQLDLNLLQEAGLIETIAPINQGEKIIDEKIKQMYERHAIYDALYKAKLRNIIITHEELDEFRRAWIESALHLKEEDIKRLGRLARAQRRIVK